jgi:hypothetical protein
MSGLRAVRAWLLSRIGPSGRADTAAGVSPDRRAAGLQPTSHARDGDERADRTQREREIELRILMSNWM